MAEEVNTTLIGTKYAGPGRYIMIVIENEIDEINSLEIALLLKEKKYETLKLIEHIEAGVYNVDNEYTQAARRYYEELQEELGIKYDEDKDVIYVPKGIVVVDVIDDWESHRLIFKDLTEEAEETKESEKTE